MRIETRALFLHDPALECGGTPLATSASGEGGLGYGEWLKVRLVLLQKKRGRSLAKNW